MKILSNKRYKQILMQADESFKKGYEEEIDKLYNRLDWMEGTLNDVYANLLPYTKKGKSSLRVASLMDAINSSVDIIKENMKNWK